MNNNIVIEKFRLFFKDLIVLGRETLYCFENDLVIGLVYELYLNGDSQKWYNFFYDIKIKKWILTSYENENPVIFNPKYKDIGDEFLINFSYEDILNAHNNIEQVYKFYEQFKSKRK